MIYELNRLYNLDCMVAMAQIPDKYFQLAIIDPPYGIGESGRRNHTRSRLARARQYPTYYGADKSAPSKEFFAELFRVSDNQIIFGANHLSTVFRSIVRVGLFGIKKMVPVILLIVNWLGLALRQPCGYSVLSGRECCKVICSIRSYAYTQTKSLLNYMNGF